MRPTSLDRDFLIFASGAALVALGGAIHWARTANTERPRVCAQTQPVVAAEAVDPPSPEIESQPECEVVECGNGQSFCAQTGLSCDGPPRPKPKWQWDGPPANEITYGREFAFVVNLDQPYVVMSASVKDEWRGDGLRLQDPDTAFANANANALPDELREWEGRKLDLFDVDGKRLGAGVIGVPRLVTQASGMLGPDGEFDTHEIWFDLEQGDELSRADEQRLTKALWDSGQRLLIAPIKTRYRGDSAAWARESSLPAPVIYQRKSLEGSKHAERERARFMVEPQGQELAMQLYETSDTTLGELLKTEGFYDKSGQLALVTTFVEGEEFEQCGFVDSASWVTMRPGPNGDFVTGPGQSKHTGGPALVFDVNHDGYPDMLLKSSFLELKDSLMLGYPLGFEQAVDLPEVPFFGCRC